MGKSRYGRVKARKAWRSGVDMMPGSRSIRLSRACASTSVQLLGSTGLNVTPRRCWIMAM
ncbi:hypothetical protein D3C76_1435280 [compost metagenome]